MIISDEQVRRSLAYLQTQKNDDVKAAEDDESLTPDLLAAVTERLRLIPDTRPDRVEAARKAVAERLYDPEEIAHKMIGRIISDSVR